MTTPAAQYNFLCQHMFVQPVITFSSAQKLRTGGIAQVALVRCSAGCANKAECISNTLMTNRDNFRAAFTAHSWHHGFPRASPQAPKTPAYAIVLITTCCLHLDTRHCGIVHAKHCLSWYRDCGQLSSLVLRVGHNAASCHQERCESISSVCFFEISHLELSARLAMPHGKRGPRWQQGLSI